MSFSTAPTFKEDFGWKLLEQTGKFALVVSTNVTPSEHYAVFEWRSLFGTDPKCWFRANDNRGTSFDYYTKRAAQRRFNKLTGK
jgi:hypothetical protein